jgi:hypothetical protein
MYSDKVKVNWLAKMEQHGIDVLNCSEATVRSFLKSILIDDSKATRKSYINKSASVIRGLFRAIGREHAMKDAKVFDHLGIPLVNSGNPMTTATERYLEEQLKEKVAAGGIDDAERRGAPVSIVVAITTLVYHLSFTMTRYIKFESKKLMDFSPIHNSAMLCLLYAILMHDGSRPGDITEHLEHSWLFFALHEKVYWLVFVLLSPKCLKYMLAKGISSYVYYGLYKGKDKKFVLERRKGMMPLPFNGIDLFMIYLICMRCVMAVLPQSISQMVFKSVNYTALRSRRNKKMNILDFTFYSYRYACAEEDKKGNINESWTRQRMGHTDTSNEKDEYA